MIESSGAFFKVRRTASLLLLVFGIAISSMLFVGCGSEGQEPVSTQSQGKKDIVLSRGEAIEQVRGYINEREGMGYSVDGEYSAVTGDNAESFYNFMNGDLTSDPHAASVIITDMIAQKSSLYIDVIQDTGTKKEILVMRDIISGTDGNTAFEYVDTKIIPSIPDYRNVLKDPNLEGIGTEKPTLNTVVGIVLAGMASENLKNAEYIVGDTTTKYNDKYEDYAFIDLSISLPTEIQQASN